MTLFQGLHCVSRPHTLRPIDMNTDICEYCGKNTHMLTNQNEKELFSFLVVSFPRVFI